MDKFVYTIGWIAIIFFTIVVGVGLSYGAWEYLHKIGYARREAILQEERDDVKRKLLRAARWFEEDPLIEMVIQGLADGRDLENIRNDWYEAKIRTREQARQQDPSAIKSLQ